MTNNEIKKENRSAHKQNSKGDKTQAKHNKASSNTKSEEKVIKKKNDFRCERCSSGVLELVYCYPDNDKPYQLRKCNFCGAETKHRPIRQDIIDQMVRKEEARQRARDSKKGRERVYG